MSTLIVLSAFAVLFSCASANKILGSFTGTGQCGCGASQSSYSNINGIVQSYEAFGTYEQLDDNSCIKRFVEITNGEKKETIIPICCDTAIEEIKQQAEQTKKKIKLQHKKIEKQHKKIMKEQEEFSKNLHDEIKAMHLNF